MDYDAFAESLRLIESRQVEPVLRLSRRRRYAPMAVDVAGDVAVTMFARRGVGCVWSDTHVLSRRDGQWRLLGGSRGTADDELLAPRPARLPDDLAHVPVAIPGIDPRVVAIGGGGGVRDSQGGTGRWPWSGRWISYVVLRVSAEVASLAVDGRELVVPWHGRVVIVSVKRRPSAVTVYDREGRVLGEGRPQAPRA